jgi:hypothetical protein
MRCKPTPTDREPLRLSSAAALLEGNEVNDYHQVFKGRSRSRRGRRG